MEKTRGAEAQEGAGEAEQRVQHARPSRLQHRCQVRAAPPLLGYIKLQSNLISII